MSLACKQSLHNEPLVSVALQELSWMFETAANTCTPSAVQSSPLFNTFRARHTPLFELVKLQWELLSQGAPFPEAALAPAAVQSSVS